MLILGYVSLLALVAIWAGYPLTVRALGALRGADLAPGTYNSILKQAGLKE